MLQSIRDHTQGWIAGVIVSLLIVSFALWGIHSYFGSGGNTNIIAKVNGVEITKNQLAVTYEQMRRHIQGQFASPESSMQIQADLKKRALETLVNIQILKQESIRQGYRISNEQIDSFLEHIPDFQVNGQFSLNRFQQLLATTMMSGQEFLDLIHTNLLIEQPRLGIIFTSFALPNEVFDTFSLIEEQRDINYAIIPLSKFSKQNITISDGQIITYYNQHENEFRTQEQASIEYILLSINDLIPNIQVNEQALKSFYDENSASYSEPMRWKLEVREYPSMKQIKEKEFKDWVSLSQVPNDWQTTLLNLKKPGQVSAPIKTNEGEIILKVLAFQEAKVQPFDKVKAKVKETYVRQKAEEKFAEAKEKLSNITYEHPDNLTDAAKALNLSIKKSSVFTKEKGGSDISNNPKVREVAFSNEVITQKNNSDVIQISPDSVVVLRVGTYSPATLLPLSAVHKQIEEKLINSEIQAKTLLLANEIKEKLEKGNSISDVSNQYQLNWSKPGLIGRHSSKADPAILNAAFETSKPIDAKPTFSTAKVSSGYSVIIVNGVKEGVLDPADREHYKIFADQIQNTEGLLEYELYKDSQLLKAKVEIENM